MTEVSNFALKADPQECGCGCGIIGTLRSRPWRSGIVCVKRGCSCKACTGKRSRSKGDDRARRARKALGIPGANTRHEELLGGGVRWEAKAGAQIGPMWTAFLRAWAQSEQCRPIGDHRPFVMTAAPDNTKEQLFACRLSDLPEVVAALIEQMEVA